jgi:hypothetical protein
MNGMRIEKYGRVVSTLIVFVLLLLCIIVLFLCTRGGNKRRWSESIVFVMKLCGVSSVECGGSRKSMADEVVAVYVGEESKASLRCTRYQL